MDRKAIRWGDSRIFDAGFERPPTNAPTSIVYNSSAALAFADQAAEGDEETANFSVTLPSSYKDNCVLTPHIYWVGEDDSPGNVVWKLTYAWANDGDVFPEATKISVVAANIKMTNLHNRTVFSDIVGIGKRALSTVACSLTRNSSNVEDTYNGKDAYLMDCSIHFEMSTLGRPAIIAE
jgi:hypothetical protein